MSARHILITGAPGVGKTTLIKTLVMRLSHIHAVGFFTEEIRDRGVRKGFELVSLDGRKQLLSHVDLRSPHRVGKYGVHVDRFEAFLQKLSFIDSAADIIVIDEIGKMELLSKRFQTLLGDILNDQKPVVATIALRGGGLISSIKARKDIILYEITLNNRDRLLSQIVGKILRGSCASTNRNS